MMTFLQAEELLIREDSYSRMWVLLICRYHLTHDDWCRLLGKTWSGCDNIRQYRLELRKALGTLGPIRQMMSAEDNAAYDALPEIVTCFRGCDASKLVGASWSLDENVANSFPFLPRYKAASPVVVTAKVRKDQILAVDQSRGEAEIITFSARRLTVRPADELSANDLFEKRHLTQMAKNEARFQAKLQTAIGAPVGVFHD